MSGKQCPRLLVASSNVGKAQEAERLLRAAIGPCDPGLSVLHLGMLPPEPAPLEDGATYLDNAVIKALAAARRLGGVAILSDDSGIEIDALGGAPGIRSARWGTRVEGQPLAPDALNALLLEQLRAVPPALRRASMVAAVVLRLPDGRQYTATGIMGGCIALDSRGSGGFGFDSIFLLPDGRRLSEVEAEEKDAVSHRGQAIRQLAPHILRWISEM